MDKDQIDTNKANEYLCIETLLKARTAEESGERFLYLEASREEADQHNDLVLAKALQDSTDHFLKFGNIDIDHKSMASVAAAHGIEDPENWEIGVPEEVSIENGVTMVKARLFKGDTPLAAKANMVWDSMTKLSPPARWYASVGGATLAKANGIDPSGRNKVNFITKVRWSNLAISRQPVNQHVSAARTMPFGVLAKCWTPEGFDLHKALEASYATDTASLTGGGAFGKQSLDSGGEQPKSYFNFRDLLAKAIADQSTGTSQDELIQYSAHEFNLSADMAEDWVDRFLGDLKSSLSNRRIT